LKIFYACGASDGIAEYERLRDAVPPAALAQTYTSQFLRLCCDHGIEALLVFRTRDKRSLTASGLRFLSRPVPFSNRTGLLYHLGQLYFELWLVWRACLYGPDVALLRDSSHWFAFGLMRLFGIRLIPTLHNTLWPPNYRARGWGSRVVRLLNARFFRTSCSSVLVVSPRVAQQVRSLTATAAPPVVRFRPYYPGEYFAGTGEPDPQARPFRILYVGRMTTGKGVLTALLVAKSLRDLGALDFRLDLCGDGPALAAVLRRIELDDLSSRVTVHGHCDAGRLLSLYQACHVVLVPTTSRFNEGLAKVAAEAVICLRPPIVSSVCPISDEIVDSAVIVGGDDPEEYVRAVECLSRDPERYNALVRNCYETRGQYLDSENSFGAAVADALGLGAGGASSRRDPGPDGHDQDEPRCLRQRQ